MCILSTPIPKWLSYLPHIFVPRWLSSLSAQLEIWGSKSNIFARNFHHQEVFRHRNFGRHFGAVVVYYYYKNHTYNYSVNGQWALISPNFRTQTITLRQNRYLSMQLKLKNHTLGKKKGHSNTKLQTVTHTNKTIWCSYRRTGLSLRDNGLKFKTSGKLPHRFWGIYGICLRLIEEKPTDHNP